MLTKFFKTMLKKSYLTLVSIFAFCFYAKAQQPMSSPTSLRNDITITRIMGIPYEGVTRMVYNKIDSNLYYATYDGDIRVIKNFLQPYRTDSLLFTGSNHGIQVVYGLLVKNNSIYVSGSNLANKYYKSYIKKATLQINGSYTWSTVASTASYAGGKYFNHLFSGITFNPAQDTIVVCSGSRGDHGEIDSFDGTFPNKRGVPLAAIILKVPADSINIILPNNVTTLNSQGRLVAKGIRNTYDFAYNAKGELFGAENSSDADHEDEINWIRQGKHYGYPWVLGSTWNPQYFSSFNPVTNVMVPKTSYSYINNQWKNDPTFPVPTQKFILPCANNGPDADMMRDTATGAIIDASALGKKCYSLTSHRSPLGILFDTDSLIGCDLKGDGFVLSFTRGNAGLPKPSSLLTPFNDNSEDLLQLEFTKNNTKNVYEFTAKKIVTNFWHPVDAVQIENSIYVMETGDSTEASIWKVELPAKNACPVQPAVSEEKILLNTDENYEEQKVLLFPNPAYDKFYIDNMDNAENLQMMICNSTGQLILKRILEEGITTIDTDNFLAGLYNVIIFDDNNFLYRETIVIE